MGLKYWCVYISPLPKISLLHLNSNAQTQSMIPFSYFFQRDPKHAIVRLKVTHVLSASTNRMEEFKRQKDKVLITYLWDSIADPSSNISSKTSSGVSARDDDSLDFFRNIFLNTPIPGFLGCWEGVGFSGGNISTTMHVVSSRSPLNCTASWRRNQPMWINKHRQCNYIKLKALTSAITLTIWAAAASGGNPRQQFRACSEVRASHTPSLEIIRRPPAQESCSHATWINTWEIQIVNHSR